MTSRRRLTLSVLLASFLLGMAMLFLFPDFEPHYQHRRLSLWLDDANPIRDEETKKEAHIALTAIGTNAIPHLLKMVTAHDSVSKQKLAEFTAWQSIIPWSYQYERAAAPQRRAVDGFRELGGEAASAIPAITSLLKNLGTQIRRRAVIILGSIGENDEATARLLIATVKDSSQPAAVRAGAIEAMAAWTNRVTQLLPLFFVAMRNAAITALGQLGRSSANELIPLLIEKYGFPDDFQKIAVQNALGDLGARSKEAIDLLLDATKDGTDWIWQNAALVLLKIDRPALERELADHADSYDERVLEK